MIEKTDKKLREAQFFYQQLVSERQRIVRSDPEAMLHYLSAFLSAARSVTLVMQKEEKEKYDAWFPAWKDKLINDERDLLELMNKQRVAEVHHEGANTTVDLEYIPMVELLSADLHGHPAYGFHWFGPPGTQAPHVMRPAHYFKLGGDKVDVTQTCKQYLDLLEKWVREFKEAHQ
jgi:hypothetical protein